MKNLPLLTAWKGQISLHRNRCEPTPGHPDGIQISQSTSFRMKLQVIFDMATRAPGCFSGKEPIKQFSPGPDSAPGPGNDISIVPRWHIFGSDELSNSSPAINSLAPPPYALMNQDTARGLEVQQGNGLKLDNQEAPSLEVLIDESVAPGCVICPVLDTTRAYLHLTQTGGSVLVKDESWTPRSTASSASRSGASNKNSIIMSDRGK